jgi:hypothetical protein
LGQMFECYVTFVLNIFHGIYLFVINQTRE